MPRTCDQCGVKPGYGHADGCSWRHGKTGDPMSVACPNCHAEPYAPCRGRKNPGVHMIREAAVAPQDPNDPVFKIVSAMTLISSRGHEGPHADDQDCGCGRCCAKIVDDVMAEIRENSVSFFGR